MPLAFDATSNSTDTGVSPASPVTWQHTCAGSDRLLIVAVLQSTITACTVTYNGVSLTLKVTGTVDAGTYRVRYFTLVNPPVGTFTISVSHSGDSVVIGGAISLTGVDQTSTFGQTGSRSETANTLASRSFTSVVNNAFIVEASGVDNSNVVLVASAGQVQKVNLVAPVAVAGLAMSYFFKATAGAQIMTETDSNANINNWAMAGAVIQPAAEAAVVTPTPVQGAGGGYDWKGSSVYGFKEPIKKKKKTTARSQNAKDFIQETSKEIMETGVVKNTHKPYNPKTNRRHEVTKHQADVIAWNMARREGLRVGRKPARRNETKK